MTPHLKERGFTCILEFDKNEGNRDYHKQKEATYMKRILRIGMDVHSTNYTSRQTHELQKLPKNKDANKKQEKVKKS